MRKSALPIWCVPGLLCLVACGAESDQGRFSAEWFTEGQAVVVDEPRDEHVGAVDLTLGDGTGGEETTFGRVTGLVIDTQGRIIVADGLEHRIGVFSEEGAFEFWIGRRGSGPGEMISPCCLAVGPEGLLWVRDNGNGRLHAFQIDGGGAEYRRSVPAPGTSSMAPPLGFTTGGNLVDVTLRFSPQGFVTQRHVIHGTTGRVLETHQVPLPPPDRVPVIGSDRRTRERANGFFHMPLFAPKHLIAHGPTGDWAEAISSDYDILWYREDGQLLRIRRDVGLGPRLTAAERERAANAWRRVLTDQGQTRKAASPEVPERKPVLSDLFFDADGRLWIVPQPRPEGPCTADVLERSGSYAAGVRFPCGVELYGRSIRGSTGLGVTRDRWGVETVVRLRFRPASDSTV